MGDVMDIELFRRIAYEMTQVHVKSITFSGGGEPLTHPDFPLFVEAAKQYGFHLGLYTSAILARPQLATLIKKHFDWVVVSLDESTREAYFKAKQIDAFQKALQGITNLVQADGTAIISASFLLRQENIDQIADMLALHRALHTSYAEFRPIVNFDLHAPDKVVEDTSWMDAYWDALTALAALPDVELPLEKFHRYRHWERDYKTCAAILFTSVITPNGKVWTCVNRRGFPDSCIGDLTVEPFEKVWRKQKGVHEFSQCRVLCRGDALNVHLDALAKPIQHAEFL